MMNRIYPAAFALTAFIFPASASAGTVSGQVSGIWLNPVLSGNVINLDGTPGPTDNTSTAVYSTSPSNDLKWGTNTTSGPPSPYSEIVFQGSNLSNVASGQEVLLGTLSFLNGTSALNSLLFGATLRISIPGNLSVTPLDAVMQIATTVNGGVCVPCDADFIQFTNVNIGSTINVNEGASTDFNVYGKFIGDPIIVLTRYTVTPGSTGGFVGNCQPSLAPEPASMALFATGLAAIASAGRRRKRA